MTTYIKRHTTDWLPAFIRESNRIEGISRPPTKEEFFATNHFIRLNTLLVEDLIKLVAVLQPDALFRDGEHIFGVRVGNHVAPPSGPRIRTHLGIILEAAMKNDLSPYVLHHKYETLLPFTAGNGRSGRALWLWHMLRRTEWEAEQATTLGFLHTWYYQSLRARGL